MELKQLISVDYLRENFTEVAGRIARYGEVYVIQNDTPKYVIRPLEEGGSAPPALSREAERAPALRRGEKADGPQAQQYRKRGICYLL